MKTSCVAASSTTAILLLLLLFISSSKAKLVCNDVITYLTPCIPYLKGVDPTPSFTCCEGAKNIVLVANASMEDKMLTCDCLKQTAAFINPKPDRANDLPNKCRVRFPFEISSTFDCSSIFVGDGKS
ncbi:unnamed protein product [Trifolium pratense]|uniref:Uncharacterized protein n=1 Tax=Trifolium pratense TaxID=57577 RepID=A0ACB0KRB8_TRIPR|nr:unnamed protein product [Trifolium pratense]